MFRYWLPLKFILLWILNLAILTAVDLFFGIHQSLSLSLKDVTTILLVLGAVLALAEQWLWDKLHGNE